MTTEVAEPEVFALDLDWDVIQHLALPESIGYFQAEQFTSELLEDDLSKAVFEFQMEHMREHSQPATPAVLEDEFNDVTIEKPQAAIGDLITRIRERYVRNSGRKITRHLAELAVDEPLTLAKTMLREGRKLSQLTVRRGEVIGTGEYHRAMAEYDRQALKGKGPSLGFDLVDDHFNGQRGVTFLLAAHKTYKSWVSVNAAVENVMQGGFAYVYSLELPAIETDMRMRCMAAGVPYWKYLKSAFTPEDREALRVASEGLDGMGIFKVEKPEPGERGTQRMIERAIDSGATSIFIDQLQYMENKNGTNIGSANSTGDYWEVCNDLRDYSDEVPIFVVHQFNRSVMSAKEMPEMQQAKGSAAIEEVATLALGLWANKEMRRSNLIHLGTLASRNYAYETWEVQIELGHSCEFKMVGPVQDDEEE